MKAGFLFFSLTVFLVGFSPPSKALDTGGDAVNINLATANMPQGDLQCLERPGGGSICDSVTSQCYAVTVREEITNPDEVFSHLSQADLNRQWSVSELQALENSAPKQPRLVFNANLPVDQYASLVSRVEQMTVQDCSAGVTSPSETFPGEVANRISDVQSSPLIPMPQTLSAPCLGLWLGSCGTQNSSVLRASPVAPSTPVVGGRQ